jgi:hypothetical protein
MLKRSTEMATNEGKSAVSLPTVIFASVAIIAGLAFEANVIFWGDENYDANEVKEAPENWQQVQQSNRIEIETLQPGYTRSQVVEALGTPDFSDIYGNAVEVLFYRTRAVESDGQTSKRSETTPLLFVEDKLIVRGDTYVAGSSQSRQFASNWQERQAKNRHYIRELSLGTLADTVVEDLGDPDFVEQIGDTAKILFYRTHVDQNDVRTDKYRETRPLVFIHNELVAIDFAQPPEEVFAEDDAAMYVEALGEHIQAIGEHVGELAQSIDN